MPAKIVNWKEIVKDWEKSNIPQGQYCRENNINLSTFSTWKSRLKNQTQHLTQLPITTTLNEYKPIEIYIESKKLTIKLSRDFDEKSLNKIFNILGV